MGRYICSECSVFYFCMQVEYKSYSTHLISAGGREKAPAAFCRKALTSTDKFEMWGDGLQTRSFTFIDECVEGVLRYVSFNLLEV